MLLPRLQVTAVRYVFQYVLYFTSRAYSFIVAYLGPTQLDVQQIGFEGFHIIASKIVHISYSKICEHIKVQYIIDPYILKELHIGRLFFFMLKWLTYVVLKVKEKSIGHTLFHNRVWVFEVRRFQNPMEFQINGIRNKEDLKQRSKFSANHQASCRLVTFHLSLGPKHHSKYRSYGS